MTNFKILSMKDYDSVKNLCKHIWDGDDYIPYVYKNWVNDNNGCFIGIEDNNEIIAFGKYSILDDKQGWLEGLRVHPNHRGKKLAHKITDKMIDLAKDDLKSNKINAIAMATHKTTTASIHLMESRGFILDQSTMLVFKSRNSMINDSYKNLLVEKWDTSLDDIINNKYLLNFKNRIVGSFKFTNLCKNVFNDLNSNNAFIKIKDNKYIVNIKDKSCSIMCINEDIESINMICDYILLNNDMIEKVSVAISHDDVSLISELKNYQFSCIDDFSKDCLYYLYK